ncbi:MAG TPA: hypothetical protein VGI45_14635 [Terracidiphilus sp.]|jgi:rRNA maturation endonuclease Nob1
MENSKRSIFSSIFGRGKKQHKEAEEAAELEARQKLEKRIQQILAEAVEAPKPVVEENHVALVTQDKEVEALAEVLPITASALSRRKAPAPADFFPPRVEVERRYVANERW